MVTEHFLPTIDAKPTEQQWRLEARSRAGTMSRSAGSCAAASIARFSARRAGASPGTVIAGGDSHACT